MKTLQGLIIILGSPNDDDGNLSDMGCQRIELGYQEYKKQQASSWKFLLTGGFGEHFNRTAQPNAFYAKQLLVARGVPETDIVEFALSINTVDDALQSRPIVKRYGSPALLIVSSDFHMARVEFVFQAVFPDHLLAFKSADYIKSRSEAERERLMAHEQRELASLRERGESIVGGALNVASWRTSGKPDSSP